MKAPVWARALLRLYPRRFRRRRGDEMLDFVTAELERAGPRRGRAALRMALDLALGGVRSRVRPTRGSTGENREREGWAMGMLHDVRLAARGLRRTPGLTAVVLATLALGAGLDTALFSVAHEVLLRPLPFPGADRLVYLEARRDAEELRDVLVSGGDWRALREGTTDVLEALEGIGTIRQNLNGAGLPRQVEVGWVSPGFQPMLGVEPQLGRLFHEDDPPGSVLLSDELWRGALGADPSVIGTTLRLDGYPHVVVGVLPPSFRAPLPRRGRTPEVELWKNPDSFWQNGDVWHERGPEFGMLRLVGRMQEGVTIQDTQRRVDSVMEAARSADARYARAGFAVAVEPLQDRLVAPVRPTLVLLTGAVVFVLLIACANVANLLLVRAQGRRRELAMRLALGSSRRRVARLLLLESLVLASLGAVAGLVVTYAFLRLVPSFAPEELSRLDLGRLDVTVLGYAFAAAAATTLLVGVAPAFAAARTDPATELGNGPAHGGRGGRVRDALVVGQVGLSLVLLVGAGLLTTTMARLQRVDPGFDPDGLYAFGVSIPGAQYGWPEEAGRFYRDVEARVAKIPGVRSAGTVWPMPYGGTWSGDVEIVEGEPRPLGLVPYYLATEAYFPTAGIPLVEGRSFRDGDARLSVVISRSVAQRAFRGRPAVGGILRADPWGRGMEPFEVIGVVGDVRDKDLREASVGALYFDARWWSWVDWEVHVVARTDVAAASLVPALREAVASLDPEVPLAHPETMASRVAAQTASVRFVLALLALFALTAATLAVVGLYGVVAYGVGLRRREIGIRMALGSRRGRIARMVVGWGGTLASVGLLVGLVGALLLGGLLEGLLYGVRPRDPVTIAAAGAVLGAAAVVASWLPARRAARTDPAEVLRGE